MSRIRIPRFAKIAVISLLGLAFAFTAVVGFAHTKSGRPLLAVMGPMMGMVPKSAGCPLGYDIKATPEQKDAAMRAFAVAHHGDSRALARPALGFVLDRTTRDDVLAWAKANGVTCTKPRSGHDLDCAHVTGSALPASFGGVGLQSLWLNFGAKETLISVIAVRKDKDVAAISATYESVTGDLAKEAGPAASVVGDGSAARLSSGLLQQATAEYKFRNYYALTRATNMGDGFVITEEYRSLPDT